MPLIDRTVAEQAFRQAGWKRPFSDGDFANAQKYGTGIFAKTASRTRNPQSLDELAQLQQKIDAAQGQYNTTQQTQVGVPDLVRTGLGERSPEFNLPREALEARYGNPQSPLYIQNPFVRQAVIEKATSGQQNAFTTVADKVNTALKLRATIQEQQLGGLKDKYGQISDLRTSKAKAAQQEFENTIALKKLALEAQRTRNSGLPAAEKPLTPAQVIALNQAGVTAKIGDKLSDLTGAQPGNTGPKNYNEFLDLYSATNQINPKNPSGLYQEFQTAQQNYNVSKDKAAYLEQLRQSAPDLAPLVKSNVVSDNPINALLAGLLSGQQ